MKTSKILAAVGVTASLAAGAMAAVAVGATSSSPAPPPQKTVTVTIPNAAQDKCITGYVPGILVINSPGGHTQIYTCVQQ